MNGPYNETSSSKPVVVPIEIGQTQAVIAASGGPWQHGTDDSRQSGPEGIDDERNLEDDRYQNAEYRSAFISKKSAKLNSLMAMFGDASAPPTAPVDQEIVGAGGTFAIPEGAKSLFLGFHDGHEWCNNSGSVNVVVTLS